MAVLKYWDEDLAQWLPVAPGPKGLKGDKGDTGDLANLDIGTVTTGSPAAAHIDGNFEDGYTLDLTLPSVGAGSIHNADVNAAADIDRSKIAGTALTQASTGIFSVKDFGAVGDGTTDDTTAIRAALAAVSATGRQGGTVWFPQGTYRITGSLTIASENVHIRGTGKRNVLQYPLPASDAGSASTIYNDHTGPLFHLLHSNETWGFNVADITLLGKTANRNGTDYHAFDFDLAGNGHAIRHITVTNVAIALFNTAFMGRATTAEGTGAASQLMLFTATHCDIHHNKWIAQCLNGIRWNGFRFHDNDAGQNGYQSGEGGLSLPAASNVSIVNNCLEGQRDPIKIENGLRGLVIKNNYFEQNVGLACIHVSSFQEPVDIGQNLIWLDGCTHKVLLERVRGTCTDPYFPSDAAMLTPGLSTISRPGTPGDPPEFSLENTQLDERALLYSDRPQADHLVPPRNVLASVWYPNGSDPTPAFMPTAHAGWAVPNVPCNNVTLPGSYGIFSDTCTIAGSIDDILVATFCFRRLEAPLANYVPTLKLRPDDAANEQADLNLWSAAYFYDTEWIVATLAMKLTHACTSVTTYCAPYGAVAGATGKTAHILRPTYYTVADVNDVKPWVASYGQAYDVPTGGAWNTGDEILRMYPAAGGAYKWVCTADGTPGTWKPLNLGA